MITPNYFYLDESAINPGNYLIKFDASLLEMDDKVKGSLAVMPSRLLNISHPNWLRLLRDEFGADIQGYGSMYPICYVKKTPQVLMLVKLLNRRMELAVYEREHPYELVRDEDGKLRKDFESVKNLTFK